MKRFAILSVIIAVVLVFSSLICYAENYSLQNDVKGGFNLEYSGITFTEDRNGNADSAIMLTGDYWMKNEVGALGTALAESKELTLSAFIRIGASPETYHHIIGFQRADGNYVALIEDAWDQYVVRAYQTGAEFSNTAYAGEFTLSTWKNVAITIGYGYAIIYVDGTEVGSFEVDPALVFEDIKYLSVGNPAVDCALDPNRATFNGAMDDIKIYTTVLSASDIALLAAGNNVGTPAAAFDCDKNDTASQKPEQETSNEPEQETSKNPEQETSKNSEQETPMTVDSGIYIAALICIASLSVAIVIIRKKKTSI